MIASLTQPRFFQLQQREFLLSALQILGASFFIALCAQISIPLYFTPVPLSGLTFSVMLIGATLGARKGVLAVLAYLLEGTLGLPVFSRGNFGLLYLMGPTGGYLVGLLVQAYLVGWFVERQTKFQGFNTMAFLLLSCSFQLGLGALWLSRFVGLEQTLLMGITPFIIGEIVKCLSLTAHLKRESA